MTAAPEAGSRARAAAAARAGKQPAGRGREGLPSRLLSFLRRAGWLAGVALVALSVAGAFAASREARPAPPARGPVVRVARVSGEVSWRGAGGGPWQPLEVGVQLGPGDWVRTGAHGSFVELVYIGEAARLWVEAGTLLQVGGAYQALAQVSGERHGLPPFRAAFLQAGRLWARVVSGLSRLWRFEIETPTAVAGVRGTLFRLEVTPAGETWLYVREGIVELRTARTRMLVRERESAGTGPGGQAPSEFREQSEAEAEGPGWEHDRTDEELERESEPERLAWLRWLQGELEDDLLEDESLRRALLEQARAAKDAERSGLVEWLLGLEKAATSDDEGTGAPSQPEGSGSGAHSDGEAADDSAGDEDKTGGHHGDADDGAGGGEDGKNGGPRVGQRRGWG